MSENVADHAQVEGPAWRAAVAEGLDMSLVELSLQKTPWERMLEHDEALEFADELRAALDEDNSQLTTIARLAVRQKSSG